MAREKVKQVQVFSLPTEYERQAAEARRREMMAEMLAQQAYDPGQYQGAPIPKAAPVVKALEGYLRGREMRKAREAGEKAEAEVSRAGQQIMGRLMGGAPIAEPVMPDASGLDEVRVQSQYRASPDDAMRMAMTPAGSAAMRGNPALADMLARTMEKPEAEEFYAPTETAEGLIQFGKRGSRRDTGVKAPVKEPESTTTQRDYEFARLQGYTGSFEDFRKSTAPVTKIDLGDKGSAIGQEIFLKDIGEMRPRAYAATNIIRAVNNLDRLTQKGTYTGSLAPNAVGAGQFLNSIGIKIDPKTLQNTEAFSAQVSDLVMSAQAALGGARGFTKEETAILMQMYPQIINSPEARVTIGNIIRNKQLEVIDEYDSLINDYKETYKDSRIPYKPIDDEEVRYQRWKRSQGGR